LKPAVSSSHPSWPPASVFPAFQSGKGENCLEKSYPPPSKKYYGSECFELKTDAFEGMEVEGKKVILVDDFLGMGGSIMAAKDLVEKLGVEVGEAVFIFDVDVPVYNEAVERNLKGLKRYTMVTLTETNLSVNVLVAALQQLLDRMKALIIVGR